MAWIAYLRGPSSQTAAETEVLRQGFSKDLLVRGNVNLKESRAELAVPLLIAVALAALALLNIAGSHTGRTATWVFQSILLLVGGFVTGQQVFAVRFVRSAFAKSGDADLTRVDVDALIVAATLAFPRWFRHVVAIRFTLVTVGSLLVILLLAFPSADSHFRQSIQASVSSRTIPTNASSSSPPSAGPIAITRSSAWKRNVGFGR